MSDFLIQFGATGSGPALLALLRRPFEKEAPEGWFFEQPWGGWALLADAIATGKNLVRGSGCEAGWVGDLCPAGGREALVRCLETELKGVEVQGRAERRIEAWRDGQLAGGLSGAFAVVMAGADVVVVLTDPMGAVQVYAGTDAAGRLRAVGTHPDLVAGCASGENRIDPVSVCEFLNGGTPCWPFTMHQGVRELAPGCVHLFEPGPEGLVQHRQLPYWTPPDELAANADAAGLAEEFARCWRQAVARRCEGGRLGVQLSGGLDSRLVMAAIPAGYDCSALTLLDNLNREARIARRVAACYGRAWTPLERDPEYLAETALESTRFTGCEGEWHHAHALGFADRFRDMGLAAVFSGLFMDNNFKGYYARDLVRQRRLGGLLPARFRVRPRDYPGQVSDFCVRHLAPALVEECRARRRRFHDRHFARSRTSPWEWLDGYPLTQASDNTGWIVERRVMPLRLPVMDRPLVDLAFRIPIQLKADGRFFLQAARLVLGPGNAIPNANDGVHPGSGVLGRLGQRGWRRAERMVRSGLTAAGLRLEVPHSWHDYQGYLRRSARLKQLMATHGGNLDRLQGSVLQTDWRSCLATPGLPWRVGGRIIQLALWFSVLSEYRMPTVAAASVVAPERRNAPAGV